MHRRQRFEATRETRKRLNWFDYFLIAALLLLLLGAVGVGFLFGARSEGDTGQLTYTVVLSGVEFNDPTPLFAIGDSVKNENGTFVLGKIVGIEKDAHRVPGVRGGRVVFVDASDRTDCYVTVASDAIRRSGDGIRVGDVRMAAGERMNLRFGSFLHYGAQIVHVLWEEDEDEASALGDD